MSEHTESKPMSIAIVIEQFDPQAGGAERSTAQIAEELVKRGHRVTVIAGSSPRGLELPGITIEAFSWAKSSSVLRLLLFRRWAMRKLADEAFDVSLSITMAVPADVMQPRGGTVRETLLRNIALRPKARSRAIKRALLKVSLKQQALLTLERKTLADPKLKKVVAVSKYVIDQLQQHYGVADDRIALIHNAAVMPRVDDAQKQQWREQVRSGFGVPDDAVLYLFAAQNPRLKGFDSLIKATDKLVKRGLNPVVLLAGGFWYGHQMHVAGADVRDHVRFVRQTRKMAALYAAADVTVLPTYYDPSSKVVIESLMMGTPAISTAFNGASDFIIDNSTVRGRVIADPGDSDALANAMAELADADQRRLCAAATAGMAEPLSMTSHVEKLEQVLQDVCK